ncbi:MAG: Tfp pilus assembly protein PilF, partial [Parcubacteria group bacterium Gr01-1014_107]
MPDSQSRDVFLNIASYLVVIAIALLPIFFVPGVFSLASSKLTFAYLSVSLSLFFLFFYLVKKETKVTLPKQIIFLSVPIVLLVIFLSAWFSKLNFSLSAVGYGFEVDTLGFLFLLFSLLGLSVIIFQREDFAHLFYKLFLGGFSVAVIYQLLKVISRWDFLSFGLFPEKTSTLLGNWNEFGFLSGAVFILATLSLTRLLGKEERLAYRVLLPVSLITLIVVNFWLTWLVLAVVLLLLLLIQVRNDREVSLTPDFSSVQSSLSSKPKKIYLTLIAFLIALVFILPLGSLIKEPVYNFLGISFLEVSLSWEGSGKILKGTLGENFGRFMLGSGPASFPYQWRLLKPADVNLTEFWNSNFNYARSLIATFSTTTGLLGLLSWLLFISGFLFLGFKRFFGGDKPLNFLALSSFLLASYFWLVFILYSPSVSLLLFSASFSGVFIASLIGEGSLKTVAISSRGPRSGAILVSVLAVIL